MRRTTLVLLLMAAVSSVALFVVKYRVQELETELRTLDRRVAAERRDINTLEAEWSHFNEPQRLRFLAERYLGLAPVRPDRVARGDTLGERLPLRPAGLEHSSLQHPGPERATTEGEKPR